MTLKSTILAFLLLCVPIFAQLTTPTPPSDSAQGNAAVSASGDDAEVEDDFEDEEAMKMLPNVLNLAAAGNMDLAQASDMVTDAQSALGLSFEEAETI